MRIAVAGKGGAGKTTIAAGLARLRAREGERTVAVDADSNPNLAAALGVDATIPVLPASLVSRRLDEGPALTQPLDRVIDDHALLGPDGLRLLSMGQPDHAGEGCLCAAHATVRAVLIDLGRQPATTTVVDLEASPEHLSRGTAGNVDVMLLIAEPYYRSLETVRRLATLAAELGIPRVAVVANKLRSADDHEALVEFCVRHDFELAARLPWSDAVTIADRQRMSLLDAPDATALVTGLKALSASLSSA